MATSESNPASAILLISCPDRKGVVTAVTEYILKHNGNILELEQHVDRQDSIFFMRIEWDLTGFALPREEIGTHFQSEIAEPFIMHWRLHFSDETPRMAIFVSKYSHCLHDILSRYQSKEWQVEIPLIISNHPDLEGVARNLGIDYYCIPVTQETKAEAEAEQLRLLAEHEIDFIVLARYMQILSPEFITHYPNRIINIHHSFLPAFAGAKPYHSAYERGVKVIGASSHYVTSDLDAGPIIEQDVARIRHTDTIEKLIRKGRDVEKLVLSRAIWHHLQRKVLVYNNRTVIFD
ncbi:MAG: formyltetrahydrofolate deformylase [Planctomycetota bacterium]